MMSDLFMLARELDEFETRERGAIAVKARGHGQWAGALDCAVGASCVTAENLEKI